MGGPTHGKTMYDDVSDDDTVDEAKVTGTEQQQVQESVKGDEGSSLPETVATK